MLDQRIKKDTQVVTTTHLRCDVCRRVKIGTTGRVLGIRREEDLMLVKYRGKSWPVTTHINEVKIINY